MIYSPFGLDINIPRLPKINRGLDEWYGYRVWRTGDDPLTMQSRLTLYQAIHLLRLHWNTSTYFANGIPYNKLCPGSPPNKESCARPAPSNMYDQPHGGWGRTFTFTTWADKLGQDSQNCRVSMLVLFWDSIFMQFTVSNNLAMAQLESDEMEPHPVGTDTLKTSHSLGRYVHVLVGQFRFSMDLDNQFFFSSI